MTFLITTDTGDISTKLLQVQPNTTRSWDLANTSLGTRAMERLTTAHHNNQGQGRTPWTAHAMLLIDGHGDVGGPESEDVAFRFSIVTLEPNRTFTNGPPLSAYYTSFPAVDSEGRLSSGGIGSSSLSQQDSNSCSSSSSSPRRRPTPLHPTVLLLVGGGGWRSPCQERV